MKQTKRVYAWHAEWEICPREGEKRNMAALTQQFEKRASLKQEEFARVAYTIFF